MEAEGPSSNVSRGPDQLIHAVIASNNAGLQQQEEVESESIDQISIEHCFVRLTPIDFFRGSVMLMYSINTAKTVGIYLEFHVFFRSSDEED